MHTNKKIVFLFVLLLQSVLLLKLGAVEAEANRPNILFLLLNDQRNDTLGCAGHPILQTPVIDSLASEGVRFENALVTTPICSASRASIFTGLTARTHGYGVHKPAITRSHMSASYPALLRQAGYRTAFVGYYGVKAESNPEAELFDVYRPYKVSQYFMKQADGSLRHESEVAGDRAIEFLKATPKEQPFCLSISFNAVHAVDGDLDNHFPWPKAVDGMYEDVEIPAPRLSDPAIFDKHPEFLKKSLNRKRYFWRWDTPEKYQKNMKAYFRMISGVDHVIGRIRSELDRLELADNTVIIYMADHGFYMGDRGFAGKWSHYDESLRVPLIIHDPRLPQDKRGAVREQIALNLDIPSTLLELAGVTAPAHYQGSSLVPLLQGERVPEWRSDFFGEHLALPHVIPPWEGVWSERYVYARYIGQQPDFEFLHDLKTDPDQLVNLASHPEYTEVLNRMRSRSDQLKQKYEANGEATQ